jgi:putative PIN family toxin of toxin-antitoxin system
LVPSGVAGRAVDRAIAEGVVLVSEDLLGGLASVLSRSKFDPYISLEERRQFLELFCSIAQMVGIQHRIKACRDPKDDILLQLALNGEATFLVTGDRDLLELAESFLASHGLNIISPRDYLASQATG